jgi:hypothetical protein
MRLVTIDLNRISVGLRLWIIVRVLVSSTLNGTEKEICRYGDLSVHHFIAPTLTTIAPITRLHSSVVDEARHRFDNLR